MTFNRTYTGTLTKKIRDDIIRGVYPPGYHLRLEQLAKQFDVSTMPIREALRTLKNDGIVTIVPHRGTFVTRFSADELDDIYEIRATLEKMATRSAVGNLLPDRIHQLEAILARWNDHTDDLASLVHLNTEFHTTLYAASNRKHLCDTILQLRHRTSHYLHAYRTKVSTLEPANQQHIDILSACQASEKDRAARLIYDHVRSIGQSIAEYIRAKAQDSDE